MTQLRANAPIVGNAEGSCQANTCCRQELAGARIGMSIGQGNAVEFPSVGASDANECFQVEDRSFLLCVLEENICDIECAINKQPEIVPSPGVFHLTGSHVPALVVIDA